MREKLEESNEWKAVTSEEQRQACSAAVATAINWFDEEVGIDTNTSQVRALLLMLLNGFLVFSLNPRTVRAAAEEAEEARRPHRDACAGVCRWQHNTCY